MTWIASAVVATPDTAAASADGLGGFGLSSAFTNWVADQKAKAVQADAASTTAANNWISQAKAANPFMGAQIGQAIDTSSSEGPYMPISTMVNGNTIMPSADGSFAVLPPGAQDGTQYTYYKPDGNGGYTQGTKAWDDGTHGFMGFLGKATDVIAPAMIAAMTGGAAASAMGIGGAGAGALSTTEAGSLGDAMATYAPSFGSEVTAAGMGSAPFAAGLTDATALTSGGGALTGTAAAGGGGGIMSSLPSLLSSISPGTLLNGAASIGSALIGSNAAKNAANSQVTAANNATALQKSIFDQTTQNVAPWLNAGKTSLGQLMTGVNNGTFTPTSYGTSAPAMGTVAMPEQLSKFDAATPMSMYSSVGAMKAYDDYTAKNPYVGPGAWTADKFQQDPGYQFQLQQGLDALTNKASLAGGMNSNNLKGLVNYAQGLANTDYQQAFTNYQTEANRGLNEYQTGLQDYMQQFQMGQNVTSLNNQLTQQQFQDAMSTTSANNQATQQNNLNDWQRTTLNNQSITDNLANMIKATSFNNSVSQQEFADQTQLTGLNNQNKQQEFSNLAALSQSGLNAGLQQGQIGANVGQTIGNNIIGAGNAQAAGQVGTANAIAGGLGTAYNNWLQSQYMQLLAA